MKVAWPASSRAWIAVWNCTGWRRFWYQYRAVERTGDDCREERHPCGLLRVYPVEAPQEAILDTCHLGPMRGVVDGQGARVNTAFAKIVQQRGHRVCAAGYHGRARAVVHR